MKDEFDLSELYSFTDELLELADKKMPKETRKFLRIEGGKLRKITVAEAKQKVKKRTGNYLRGIKRGKVYKYEGDQTAIRVYGSSPHSHLIEHGHRQVTKDGQEIGFVKGSKVFEQSRKQFEPIFYKDCEDFVDDLLDKGLR